MIRLFLRTLFCLFVLMAAFFITLHHPTTHRMALQNKFLRPLAEAFTPYTRPFTLGPTPQSPARPSGRVVRLSPETKSPTKSAKKSPAPPSADIRSPLQRPGADHLGQEDRETLLKELESLSRTEKSAQLTP